MGIDLGTTNSALAYVDTQEPAAANDAPLICVFEVPQLVVEGEVRALPALPSFLYFVDPHELAHDNLSLPWDARPNPVAGVLAREQGALVPGRQVSSAKSWLSLASVDRTAKILPWGASNVEQACSPVEASARYLAHLRDAWNYRFAAGREDADELRFERQEIVLTVPASFDEEARELTVEAARDAGIENLTLLEEPLAAFYAWIVAHRHELKRQLKDNQLVLICDVGGGTSDFSLIRVRIIEREVRFERTATGEHLLLGGDNVDLALVRRLEAKLASAHLTLRQRNALQRQCCAAKERLLSDLTIDRVPITLLGSGRAVIGNALATELTREEVVETLVEGFLPVTAPDDLPARDRRIALRELGLPYASEPAITKHLAQFLAQAATAMHSDQGEGERAEQRVAEQIAGQTSQPAAHLIRPDAILFNGGFFAPDITRERVVEAVAHWFREKGKRWRPKVIVNEHPESAVAVGAAYYAQVRLGEGMRISGGSARGYYIGVQAGACSRRRMKCKPSA
ncbi:MAG: Hsp70 family protein [Pyrinomonadaceae bacterium]|nr:Hsp70 family protein [Pyrinomonadaceae bacterium]